MPLRTYFLFLSCLFVLLSCEEKKNEYPFVDIFPTDISIQAYTDDKIIFTIKVYSDEILNDFLITSKHEGENESVLLDSSINIRNLSFQWVFHTPADADEDIILYFKAVNVLGNQTTTGRRLVFYGKKLDEFTGLRLNGYNSGNDAGFNLNTLASVALSADSTERDLQEFQSDTTSSQLSRKWISPSGCKFVKFNDFDYGNASTLTVKSAYEAGIKLSEIAGIETGDIYLVKLLRLAPSEVFVLVKVTNMIDKDGIVDDYYEIAVKK